MKEKGVCCGVKAKAVSVVSWHLGVFFFFFFFLLYALSRVLLEGPISAFGLLCVKTHQPVEKYNVMTNAHTQW